MADDPDRHNWDLVGWDPAAGNLLLYGMSGYGTTSALATLAITVARARPPDAFHLYVMDADARKLARLLRRELEARTAPGGVASLVEVLVLIDDFASFLAGFGKDAEDIRVLEDLERVYAEGPTVGIRFAVTADRGDAVPRLWATLTEQKLLFQLADYESFDLPHTVTPGFVPGRAIVAATGQSIQFVWAGDDLAEQVARAGGCWAGARQNTPAVRSDIESI
ncbi:MAG: hypothetical protein JO345_20500 [Streptosporangiaceae bacterium]|nr:hypothetical protein [Streptosporangiaceae bacterium]